MLKRTAPPVQPTWRLSPRAGPSVGAPFEVAGPEPRDAYRRVASLSFPKTFLIFTASWILALTSSGTGWAQDGARDRLSPDARRRHEAAHRALQGVEANQKAAFQALTGNVATAAARRALAHTTFSNIRR